MAVNPLALLTPLAGTALAAAPTGSQQGGGMQNFILMMGLMFVVFYFLIIRPQSKRRRERHDMLLGLQKGYKVITTGGIHGVIDLVRDHEVIIKCDGDGVKLKIQKTGIARVVHEQEGDASSTKG